MTLYSAGDVTKRQLQSLQGRFAFLSGVKRHFEFPALCVRRAFRLTQQGLMITLQGQRQRFLPENEAMDGIAEILGIKVKLCARKKCGGA